MAPAVANNILAAEVSPKLANASSNESVRRRTARMLDRVIFSAVLVVIVLTAIPYGTTDSWLEAFFAATVFALGLLSLTQLVLSRNWPSNQLRLLLPLAALAVFALMQSLSFTTSNYAAAGVETELWQAVSADPYGTQLVVMKLLALILVAAMLLHYVSSPQRLRILIGVVVGVAAASALFGLWRQATGVPNFILPHLRFGVESSYGQFINRNHFAFLMELGLGLTLGLVLGRTLRRPWMVVYLVVIVIMFAALFLTASRGGLVSILSQAVFLVIITLAVRSKYKGAEPETSIARRLWRMIRPLLPHRVAIGSLLIIAVVGVLWIGSGPLAKRLTTLPDEFGIKAAESGQSTSRMGIWHATWQLVKANPIVGVGFGGYGTAISGYYDAVKWAPQEAHNDYLELIASGGLISAALTVWFFSLLISAVRKQLRTADGFRRAACIGASVGLFGVAVHSLFDFGLQVTINALVFTSLVVIATANIPTISTETGLVESTNRYSPRPILFASLIGLMCVWGSMFSARAGVSRVMSGYGKNTKSLPAANMAINWSPADPEAHYARAIVFSGKGNLAESIAEFERAIALRPRDYFLWLKLGRERDRAGDREGALAAFRQAVLLAPHYIQPRRRLSNLLLDLGRHDEAIAALGPGTTASYISLTETISKDDDLGFGWLLEPEAKAVGISLDEEQHFAGSRSVRLDFNGITQAEIASQLAVVEPNTRYLLRFAARTQELGPSGLPVVAVTDATGDEQMLGRPVELPASSGWQSYKAEFRTTDATVGVLIRIQRPACRNGQTCPIFGRLWLDQVSLQKFKD